MSVFAQSNATRVAGALVGAAVVWCGLGAHAATMETFFSENFDDQAESPNLQGYGAFEFFDGGLRRTWTNDHNNRHYMRTTVTDFNECDFLYEVTFTTSYLTQLAIHFIGIGHGDRRSGYAYHEPVDSLCFRIHSPNFHGGYITLANRPASDLMSVGAIGEEGTHRSRIEKVGNRITFSIDAHFDGRFVADMSRTIDDLQAVAPFLDATDTHLFFGTALPADLFDDVLVAPARPRATLVSRGADWQFLDGVKNEPHPSGALQYPTDASGRAWNDADFDVNTSQDRSRTPPVDLPWREGAAPLGAGTIDAVQIATPLAGIDAAPGGADNDVTTYLFRGEFDAPDPATINALEFRLLCDDGGIMYINGREVFRTPNMEGVAPIGTTTLADSAGTEDYVEYPLDAVDALREGRNTIAFELHQVSLGSSDCGFDLELVAVVPEPSCVAMLAIGIVLLLRRHTAT